MLTTRYYALADRLSTLVADNASGQAALELGASQRPGGVQAELNAAFDRADLDYGREATRSRNVATSGRSRPSCPFCWPSRSPSTALSESGD